MIRMLMNIGTSFRRRALRRLVDYGQRRPQPPSITAGGCSPELYILSTPELNQPCWTADLLATILASVLRKARFWKKHANQKFNDRQRAMAKDAAGGRSTSYSLVDVETIRDR